MKSFKFLTILFSFFIALSLNMANAKDREFTFTVKGYASKTITDEQDFAMLSASKYALKKGYDYFTVENISRFLKSYRKMERIGTPQLKKRPVTKLSIHCFENATTGKEILSAREIKEQIENKYSL